MRPFPTALLALMLSLMGACPQGDDSRTPVQTESAAAVTQEVVPAKLCRAHGVESSLCTHCNPALIAVFKARGDWCKAHQFPESLCPICNAKGGERAIVVPRAPPAIGESTAAGAAGKSSVEESDNTEIESKTVRFKSAEIEKNAGLKTTKVQSAPHYSSLSCTARISFNRDHIADIRPIVDGLVRKIQVKLGADVQVGTPLFELESTRVGELQTNLRMGRERVRTARANLDRQRKLRASAIASAREVELAEREWAAANAVVHSGTTTLRMAGSTRGKAIGRYTLNSPIAGRVVRRPAVLGLLANRHGSLATIADTSTMWALCNITESDARLLRLGQQMKLKIGSEKADRFSGRIIHIASELDKRSRTVLATAEVANPQGYLRANQFAEATIRVAAPSMALVVPKEAIQRVDNRSVVFIRSAPGVYFPRVVRPYGTGEFTAVEGRLRQGDAVVTTGSYLLKTEILPDSIGAGCCEVDSPGGGG